MMDPPRVFIAALPSGFFGNAGQSWETLDLARIGAAIGALGFQVVQTTIDALADLDLRARDVVVYTSSDAPAIRSYLRDVLYFVNQKCRLVPRYELLLAHENKGFQELEKKERGIGNLRGFYHYDPGAYTGGFPAVYKRPDGAGGSTVRLLKDARDARRVVRQDFAPGLRRRLILLQRRARLPAAAFAIYRYRHKGLRPYVCQEFIADLDCDYKVLVFADRFFVLKRFVRSRDFRASGSGNFDFAVEAPPEVLRFAAGVFERMEVPFISLDIAVSGGGCHLIEYQSLNFGPTTLTKSRFHYRRRGEQWQKVDGPADLNENFAHAYVEFLRPDAPHG